MLKIKNKTFSPIQITMSSRDRRSLMSTVLPGRGIIEIPDEQSTPMIETLERRGLIQTSIIDE